MPRALHRARDSLLGNIPGVRARVEVFA